MLIMGDIEKAVKKYLGDKELIFRGDYAVEGLKEAEGEVNAGLFVNTIDEDALNLINEGGKLLVVVPNRDWYVNHPTGRDWHKKDEDYILEEWKFDFEKNLLWKKVIIPGKMEKEEEIETFTPAHLKVLLETYGLKVISVFSDVENGGYTPTKPVLFGFVEKVKKYEKEEEIESAEVEPVEKKPEEKEEVVEPEAKVIEEEKEVGEVAVVREPEKMEEKRPEGEYEEVYDLKLTWRDANNKPNEMKVEEGIIIGRGKGDVLTARTMEKKKRYHPMMLFDPKKRISRKHIEILNMDNKWVMRDLGSTNGTKINGKIMPGWKKPSDGKRHPSEYVELKDGDRITLADTIDLDVVLIGKKKLKESMKEEVVEEVFGGIEEEEIEEQPAVIEEEKPPEPVMEEKVEIPCVLKWVDGNFRPHEVEINDDVYIEKRKDNVVFIKTKDGNVTIPLGIIDTENEISEKQLEIHKENGKWFLKDLGSENGTILNGKMLPGWKEGGSESEYVELKDNDEILIGRYLITVNLK